MEYMKKRGEDQMPPSPSKPVSAANFSLIEEWINKGAPNTSYCENGSCNSLSNVSYAFDIKLIMETYCNGCQNGSSGGGGYDLTTNGGVKFSVNDQFLLGSVRFDSGYEPMPLNSGKLSSCRIKTIETWIAEGVPNN